MAGQLEIAPHVQRYRDYNRDRAFECYTDFYAFFKTFWHVISGDELTDNWHIQYTCNEVQDAIMKVVRREPKEEDLIFNVPPGSSKSSIITVSAPVWAWLQKPSLTCINSSYASDLSVGHALKSKDILLSALFQEYFQPIFLKKHGKYLYLVKNTESYWKNNFGGERQTTSTGGMITGKHADIIFVDDSMSAEMAESEANIKTCHRFHDRTLPSRFKNKRTGLTIYIMQRLKEDDTTGHELMKRQDIKHVKIPSEINDKVRPKPEELAKYYIDGLLDPNRFSREVLDKFKVELGSYAYAGQFLQDPTPAGGGKIKEDWIQIAEERMREEQIEWTMFIDGAYTDNTDNDPTGIFICGVYQSVLYILHATSRFMEINELLAEIKSYFPTAKTKGLFPLKKDAKIYIEPKASGKSLAQLLRKDGFNAIEIQSDLVGAGKNARCNLMIPYIEAGRVRLVRGRWNEEVIHQWTRFPNALHDEYVDLGGYSVDKFLHRAESTEDDKPEVNPSEFY